MIPLNKPIRLGDLTTAVGERGLGDMELLISAVGALGDSSPDCLVFAKSAVMGINEQHPIIGPLNGGFSNGIESKNPRLTFARCLNWIENTIGFRSEEGFIHPSVTVAPGAQIEDGAQIGEGTLIGTNAVVGGNVVIGRNCHILSGVIVGDPGFGFERDEAGVPLRFPQLGRVVIGDGVVLGTGTVVARGALMDTVLGDDVKTDNLVHIAHNCEVGPRTMLAACAEVSGSVRIGSDVWIGPNASLMNGIRIGNEALVGLGAVVTKDVPESAIVAGNPARVLRYAK